MVGEHYSFLYFVLLSTCTWRCGWCWLLYGFLAAYLGCFWFYCCLGVRLLGLWLFLFNQACRLLNQGIIVFLIHNTGGSSNIPTAIQPQRYNFAILPINTDPDGQLEQIYFLHTMRHDLMTTCQHIINGLRTIGGIFLLLLHVHLFATVIGTEWPTLRTIVNILHYFYRLVGVIADCGEATVGLIVCYNILH